MSAFFSLTSSHCLEKPQKVVVIGAGIAGLTAAHRLHKEGIDVEVYEARNRVGGRIFTATVKGHHVELGGQNISDGGEAIYLNRLIDEFELERTSARISLQREYFSGKELVSVNKLLKEKKWDTETLKKNIQQSASTSSNMQEVLEKMVGTEDDLYKILSMRLAAYEGGVVEKLSSLYSETLFYILLGGVCSVHQGDLKEESYVDLVSIEGGNALLPEKIAEKLGSRLHLNMPLVKVSKNKEGVFELIFENGEKRHADTLILAVPCSVYEYIDFADDIIPLKKLEAIQNVQYGTNAKIMVPFEKTPFISGIIGDQAVGFFNPKEQLLTVYYIGESSYFSPATINDVYTQARPMLEKGFGLEGALLMKPSYAQDEHYCYYEGPVGYSWPSDPYARGTYSYIASGQEDILTAQEERRGETFKELFAPIEDKLYFAGEHTSILLDVPGTMEAACESGERIARSILKNKEATSS